MPISALQHDSAIRSLPRWGAVAIGAMGVLLGARAFFEFASLSDPGGTRSWDTLTFAATLWIPVSIYVFHTGITGRCSRLDMTLPVSPHRLWLRHVAGVLISSTVILTLCAALLSLQSRGFRDWLHEDSFLLEPRMSSAYPLFLSALVLSCVLLQTRRPSLRRIPLDGSYALFAVSVLFGVFVLVIIFDPIPTAGSLLLLVLTAWVGTATYRGLPLNYAQVPKAADAGPDDYVVDERLSGTGSVRNGSRSALLARTVWTTIWSWKALFYVPFVMVFGVLLAGLPSSLSDEMDTRFANIVICWYMLLSMLPAVMKKIHTLDGLPIPRALLFACLVGPGIAATAAGYGTAELITSIRAEPREHIRMREIDNHYYLTVPPENCEITWGGAIPQNMAPWGEAHDAWSAGLVGDGGVGIYSPFSTPPGSSIEFVAWQISRAVSAVYSGQLSADEIKNRYLEIDAEGRVVPKRSGLTIRADHPDLVRRGRGRVFPAAMLAACLPFLVMTAVVLLAFGVGSPSSRRIWIPVLLLAGTMTIHIALYAGALLKYYVFWVHTAFAKIVIRHVDSSLPGGTPVLWVLCGILLIMGYRFARRRFDGIEMPTAQRKPAD